MEETNFVLLWKEQYEKIDQSLAINKRILKETISQKAKSALRSLIRIKAIGIIAAVIWLLLLGAALSFAMLTLFFCCKLFYRVYCGNIFNQCKSVVRLY